MGLGLHGGGLESARFLLKHGAVLCVTDLRDEKTLAPSIQKLDQFVSDIKAASVRYVLGRHNIDDFKNSDLVIKNPGVRPDSPFLQAARRIETDISLFLQCNPSRLCCVTGSKGKSFTSSAIHWIVNAAHQNRVEKFENGKKTFFNGKCYLGGNITVSPLSFIDELTPDDDVVLELSSWQLGDLKNNILKPRVAVITAIMSDHLDRYGTMEAYTADKRIIYKAQDKDDVTIALDDDFGRNFLQETNARSLKYSLAACTELSASGAYLDNDGTGIAVGKAGILNSGEKAKIVPNKLLVPGIHQKLNLLGAALAALELGAAPGYIYKQAKEFKGIEHRLEFFLEKNGVRFYNDTAATIPEAAAAAVSALGNPILITGGTDKQLDFSPLIKAAKNAKYIILLKGTGSEKIAKLADAANLRYSGPFDSLDDALCSAMSAAKSGDSIVLSPGCASFGMFLNEFDRGRKWKETVIKEINGY